MQTPAALIEGAEVSSEYVIERALGKGGMGAVYVALQKSTGRRRALKLMHPQLVTDERAVERFMREAKVGALIHSDHIVEVIGAGVDPKSGAPWLAMELLEGEDLGERLARGPLSLVEAGAILRQVAHALAAAHAVGVVHRDLKPENVFLEQARRVGGEVTVKVLDFGIAKVLAEVSSTSSGFVGTPAYMAPEQGSSGGSVTPAADVWAFALMAFAMLTGKAYWKSMHVASSGPLQVLQELASETMEAPSLRAKQLGADGLIPLGFDVWFARATQRDATQRFASAGLAWAALAPLFGLPSEEAAAYDDTAPSGATVPPPEPQGPRRAMTLLASACVVALVVGYAFLALGAKKAEAPSDLFNVEIGASPLWGPQDALVTIIEFADFECPYSKSAEEQLDQLRTKYPNDVRLVWKHYPLGIHHTAEGASRVSNEVKQQKGVPKFWKAHDELFAAQTDLRRPQLESLAKGFELDDASVTNALEGSPGQVAADVKLANDLAVWATPTFFINGRRHDGVEQLYAVAEEELLRAKQLVANGVPRAQVYARLVSNGKTGAARPVRSDLKPPEQGKSRGSTVASAVQLIELCDFIDSVCINEEPVIRKIVEQHKDAVRLTWVSLVDSSRAESRDVARSTHAVRKTEDFWKLHDAVLDLELNTPGGLVFKPDRLRSVAEEAGVDLAAYDYQLQGWVEADIKRDLEYARAAGVTEPRLFIDGEEYRVQEPELELEAAVVRAIARRAPR